MKGVIHAHRAHLDAELLDTEFLYEILLDGLSRLRAQSTHPLIRVIAGECSEVHAGDRTQEPRSLPCFLDRAAGYLALSAAFHCTGIHPNFLDPIQIERDAGVGQERTFGERGDRARSVLVSGCDIGPGFAREVGIIVID